LLVSCVFWQQKHINIHCDADDILSVTHLVNGGQNGIAGRKAYLAKAKSLLAPISAGRVEPSGGGKAILHLGIDGAAVASLQRQLSVLGYPLALDGEFGPATEVAVKHFQGASGLPADGIVGLKTWSALNAATANSKLPDGSTAFA
jgi:putative chitinase